MTLRDPEHRVERVCDLCGQLDDHPHMIVMFGDGTSKSAHHDCLANTGYQSAVDVVALSKGKKGAALTQFLRGGGASSASTRTK